MESTHYDVLIVGAGIAGCALAHALSTVPRKKPLRIALLERSLEEPDRIVGELLQPGGVMALKKLGMESCVENIDAIPIKGYCVVENGNSVEIPYPSRHEGRGFHHGKFIMKLREAARRAKGVEVEEVTVTELIESEQSQKVIGVYGSKKSDGQDAPKQAYYADLVVIADGCFSNFRNQVMDKQALKPVTKSHFVGVVLEDARLPIPQHGTVCLTKSYGPALLYQIGTHDTRMLIDVKAPLPSDMKSHLLNNVIPELPSTVHIAALQAVKNDRLRRMPNSFLPSVMQASDPTLSKQGVILLGDAWNMRHPLTGGGMTVAFNDVVILRELLGAIDDLKDWNAVKGALHTWHWQRKPLASTVNILSVALYDLFGADDELLGVLRVGCFKYFERGGECIGGPVRLLSAITPSPMLLLYHFFAVAFYSVWVMFMHARPVQYHPDEKPRLVAPSFAEYPALFFKMFAVIWKACVVVLPLVWSEIRWWSPEGKSTQRNSLVMGLGIPMAVLATLYFTMTRS
ncbi:Squalene epoxidase [Paramarasmius palmivorus]|uniref:Squalene monooxygenase n=1 Tax=Paramarasmius palmivorus TaxID=297713 RepID=A0AAW0E303_9AGAR